MIQTRILNSEHTIIGDLKKGIFLDITKHYDYVMGKKRSFWRVDTGSQTISSLNRTKTEALKKAKIWLSKNLKEN